MTTTKKLWLGFGVLTALLVVTVSVIFIYVRALRGQVAEMATSREIGMTSREIETHVLGYALDVRRYLQTGEPDMGVGLERAAAKVDGSLAEYQRLATTAPRRAMAGQLVEHWRDLLRRGRALMQVGSRASTQQLTEFGEARSRLEGFLESEVQADAERDYETRREATRRDARNAVVVSLVLLVVGVLIGVVTSAVVGKGIIAGEGELRASEAFSRSVIESSPDCVKVLDTAGRLLRMNANGMAIMEIDDFTPLAGRPWVELWPEEKRGQVLAALDTTRAGGIGRFRSACPTARGTLKSWDVVVAPIRDADGRIASLVAVSRDVTEQERAAARERVLLAEAAGASAKFRAFFEQGALFAGIMDLDGTILEPNRVALEACGYTREQVVGKPFWDCPWWTPSAALVDQIKVAYACALGGETYRAEMPYYVADGSERMVDLIILPITDATGQILFLAPTGTDITERHRLENELRRLAADLSEADHRKNEFLAVLAHELRNPLTPIRNAVQILRLRGGDDPTIRATCEMMARQVGHMVRLVEDLLDVSRISRGKIELRRSTVELAPVLEHALEAVRPLCEEMGHELTVSVPQEPIRLDGDPVRLAQVVGNLLSNAAKFTPRGGHVWLTVERAGEQAIIRVRDQGIGIAPEQLPHIFEMFTQVDSALERSQAGLGIGLTLVKQLVELHGGTVDVHSAGLGTGTEFVVRLPVAAAPASPATQVRAAPAGATTPAVCRILVVDDNRDAVESLGLLLECDGHEVHAAYDGVEAVAAAAKLEPDLVLLDIGLPNLNGYEAARRIREQPRTRRMVLVALTGWGQDDDRRRSAEAGFDAHLVKPIDYRALSELVARVTELRSAG